MSSDRRFFIGLMAGTSLDGVDLALVAFEPAFSFLAGETFPFPRALRERLLQLCFREEAPVGQVLELDADLGAFFGETIGRWLERLGIAPEQIAAIGSHGQTLLHRPGRFTFQIGDPNRIAERTGIPVVADLRRRDVAAGGEGAPLTPRFHRELFGAPGEERAVLNLGGIANLTLLYGDGRTLGFDVGPANTLLDRWCREKRGEPFDRDGALAASGKVLEELLDRLLSDSYFALPPPKSCGPERFSLKWLSNFLEGQERPEDVQATLVELTAEAVRRALLQCRFRPRRLFLCGGGGKNPFLVARIQERLGMVLETTGAVGLDPDFVEAAAFAYFAYRTLKGLPSNLPEATGARREVVLGALYPA